jgi:SAM-dependent methyltransferase
MKDHLELPAKLRINSPKVRDAGLEDTGEVIMQLVLDKLGMKDYSATDILDVGCGSRFTLTIINRKIPVKSYTGIEINTDIVDFWNVHNDMYNTQGIPMQDFDDLPVEGDFDLIWLFSVFTHLNPDDSLQLLKLMRKKIRPGGNLFFTTHTKDDVNRFEDRAPRHALLRAFYHPDYMRELVEQAGWKVDSFHEKDTSKFVRSHFIASPA